HFTSLIFANCIPNPSQALPFATPVFQMQTYIAGRVLSQSPELYRDIQMENPYFAELLKKFEDSFADLKEIVLKKDKDAFKRFFETCSDHFDSLKKESCQITDE